MKLVNCKVNVPKKYQIAISSIECIKEEGKTYYIVTLKKGFNYTWGTDSLISFNQRELLQGLKNIVLPVIKKNEISVEKTRKTSKKTSNENATSVSKKRKTKARKVVIRKKEVEEYMIVTAFLKGEKSVKELNSEFSIHSVNKAFEKYDLKSYNYANFKGLSMSKIFATLRFYKKYDLIELFEKEYKISA